MTILRELAFVGFFLLTSASLEQDHTISIESNAKLSQVKDHDNIAAGSRVIEKSQETEIPRTDLGAQGITLMEGIKAGEASGRTAAGLVRRESTPSSQREEPDAAALEESAVAGTHHAKAHKAKRSKAVSWEACLMNECKCSARRRQVIRYQRERTDNDDSANVMTNWFVRARARPFTGPTTADFNKGFTTAENVTNLQQCGGDHAWSIDCLNEPKACTFDSGDTNPYDAKAGEYCCNSQYEYCSYKCVGEESFKCPSISTNMNFPGGMDPAGPDVIKKCYIAKYPHGLNPESATDADGDVGGKAD